MSKGENRLTDRQTGLAFDKRQTNIAKGVGILLMFCHHAFNNTPSYYEKFTSVFRYKGIPIECLLSDFSKVCVAIFVLLSGYGLYKSWEKAKSNRIQNGDEKFGIKYQFFFVLRHLRGLLFDYWLIYVIFVPLGIFWGRPLWSVYENNPFYGIIDFLGLSSLFNTPTMNGAWWFMSVIMILYCAFPVIMKLLVWSKELAITISLLIMVFPLYNRVPVLGQIIRTCSAWLFPFVIGMFLSSINGLENIQKNNNTLPKSILLTSLSVVLFAWIRFVSGHTVSYDAFFGLSIILFAYLLLSRIPILNRILEELGKYSGLMFMFHEFVRIYYDVPSSFIYFFRYSWLIIIVLSIVCYVIARLITLLKRLIFIAENIIYSSIYKRE